MKKPRTSHIPALQRAGTLHNLVLPRALDQIQCLVNTSYTKRGGMGHMTLSEWRDLEQEIKRKLEQEHAKSSQLVQSSPNSAPWLH